MSAFMHSAVSFGTPDIPPPGVGSSHSSNITAQRYRGSGSFVRVTFASWAGARGLFTGVRGSRILGSSDAGSCIDTPARPLLRTKNVRVSDGDPRRNQPHPNEDDKPPGRRFLRSSSHLAILPPNTLRHHGRYIRSSSLGPPFCPYSAECVEGLFSEVRIQDRA